MPVSEGSLQHLFLSIVQECSAEFGQAYLDRSQWSAALNRFFTISGAGHLAAFKALERKGLIEPGSLGMNSFRITDSGTRALSNMNPDALARAFPDNSLKESR